MASFTPGDVDRLAGDAIGDFGAYYFLYVVKQPVPEHDAAQAIIAKRKALKGPARAASGRLRPRRQLGADETGRHAR